METLEKLNEMDKKLDTIIQLLNRGSSASVSQANKDGISENTFVIMSEPKQWSSGKGVFCNCKLYGSDDWYSVGISSNVASKASYTPKKGDTITVRGKIEENEKNGKLYRSVFAVTVSRGFPHVEPSDSFGNEDVPF
jgi:hypothetical protein